MRKAIIPIIAAILFQMVASLSASAGETIHLTYAHNRSDEDIVGKAVISASKKLYDRTNGRYDLRIYSNGTYATNVDCMQAVILGSLDFAMFDTGMDWEIRLGTLLTPYTFKSYDHWLAFKKSPVYEEFVDDMDKSCGIHHLGFYTFGFRFVTGNKVWKTPEDFKNVKLRMAVQAPYPEIAIVLGCAGTPLDANEVYMALQTGVMDGQENALADILSRKFFEVQKYIMKTEHGLSVGGVAMSNKAWNSLDAETQAIITQVFKEMNDELDAVTIEQEPEMITFFEKNGCEFVEVDKQPFIDRAPLVFQRYPDFRYYYDKIQEIKY